MEMGSTDESYSHTDEGEAQLCPTMTTVFRSCVMRASSWTFSTLVPLSTVSGLELRHHINIINRALD